MILFVIAGCELKLIKMNDLISIVIPLYNAEKFICSTLLSVESQSYPNKEVIVVDDCSTDSSPNIVKKMQSKMPYLKYHRLMKNSGVAIARNTGIELAKGRFIAFIDSDDLWSPEKIQKQLKLFDIYPNTPFTYTAIYMINEQGVVIKNKRNVKSKVDYSYILKNTMIATSTVIIDRKVVPRIQMPLRKSAEDYSLWLQILRDYGPAYGLNEALTAYRISSTSLSHNKFVEIKYFYAVQTQDLHINKLHAAFNTIFYIFNAIKKHFF